MCYKFSAPCRIPNIPHGIFKVTLKNQTKNIVTLENDRSFHDSVNVTNGKVVSFSCSPGYQTQGSSKLKCWHGEWITAALPECVAGNKLQRKINSNTKHV